MWGNQADNRLTLHTELNLQKEHVCVWRFHPQNPQWSQTSLWGIFSPACIPPTVLNVCPPVLSQPRGAVAVNLTHRNWNGNAHVYVHCGLEEGGPGKRNGAVVAALAPLARWKALKACREGKALSGQKSNSQGCQRETGRPGRRRNFLFTPSGIMWMWSGWTR